MANQPTALRLAQWLDGSDDTMYSAAAELRRLHQANQELKEALRDMVLIFTPVAKDSTAANLIDKATSLITKHKEQA